MRNTIWSAGLLAMLTASATSQARPLTEPIVPGDLTVRLEKVVSIAQSPYELPLELASPRDGTGRLFPLQRIGVINILRSDGTLAPNPLLRFADAGISIELGGEAGAWGLAFSPNFATDKKFYTLQAERFDPGAAVDFRHPEVSPTTPTSNTTVREWTISDNPDVANLNSRVLFRTHNPG